MRDITPPVGALLSGFVARTQPAVGAHDPLTVRALVVEDSAVVTVDVVGLHEDTCARIRERCAAVADVVVHATHTHGGPVSMPGRLGESHDHDWLVRIEAAAVDAVHEAAATREAAWVRALDAPDPGIAQNRRRAGGPTDNALPVAVITDTAGRNVATVISYACHPVVLGADNLLMTADYPGVVRRQVEAELGGVALFLTGCAGDANTGHPAAASVTTAASDRRTFAVCEEVGGRIAAAVLDGLSRTLPEPAAGSAGRRVTVRRAEVTLALAPPSADALASEAERWARAARSAVDDAQRALWDSWARWARDTATRADTVSAWNGHVTLMRWGPLTIVALPGEPFAATAEAVRRVVGPATTVVAGYCDGCPGYIPPADEYASGGYEIEDAHRYYGMPGPFAPGSAERLVDAVVALSGES